MVDHVRSVQRIGQQLKGYASDPQVPMWGTSIVNHCRAMRAALDKQLRFDQIKTGRVKA